MSKTVSNSVCIFSTTLLLTDEICAISGDTIGLTRLTTVYIPKDYETVSAIHGYGTLEYPIFYY